jgi:hypothetical protein
MPISQILLTAGSYSGPRVSWSNIYYSNVNEGQQNTVYLDFRDWVDSTVYWWIVDAGNNQISNSQLSSATSGTFSPGFGSYTNYESFNFTFAEDATADGELTYYIRIENADGQLLMPRQGPFTVNDTSQTPEQVPPFSLQFDQPQGDYLSTPANADWNLGTSWTIEFWLKANSSGYSGNPRMSGDIWGLLNQGGWGTTNSINIAISDAKLVFLSGSNAYDDVRYTEPTPNQWTHVAIVNNAGTQTVWYNGSEQTKVSGTFGTANYANSTDSLAIGTLSGGNNYFDGKMAMVRISNTAKYSAPFTPTVTYGVDADTKLFLSSDTPLVDSMSHTITNNGVTESTTFVNRYTATHPVVNGGSTNPHIDSNPSNDAWAATVPQGARIISSVTGRFVLNALPQISLSGTWLFVVGGSNNFTAGETHTFIW